MSFQKTLHSVQQLFEQLTACSSDELEKKQRLMQQCSQQLTQLADLGRTMQQALNDYEKQNTSTESESAVATSPTLKAGCYTFAGEKGYFCPTCYDNDRSKIPTVRINSKLRVCQYCRSSLKT